MPMTMLRRNPALAVDLDAYAKNPALISRVPHGPLITAALQARAKGLPYAAPPGHATHKPKAPTPTPASATPKAPTVQRQTIKQPTTIPQAMAGGWTNAQIQAGLKSGALENCRTPDEAARQWWPPSDIVEARRRGLIW